MLFRRREIVETMMGFLMVVEVETGGRLSVQLSHQNENTAWKLVYDRFPTGSD